MKTNSTALKLEQTNEVPALHIMPKEVINEVKPVEEVKPLTIEDIKRKNEVLKRLTDKYDRLNDKLRRVENFKLSSDRETATIVVTDSNGEEFQSNSQKTMVQLIAFWHEEFKQAIAEVEREIRENA